MHLPQCRDEPQQQNYEFLLMRDHLQLIGFIQNNQLGSKNKTEITYRVVQREPRVILMHLRFAEPG